jgi:hypothetical protein
LKLFDHLVGASEHARWHFDAERLGSLEVDHQLQLGWLLDRKIARLLTFGDPFLGEQMIKITGITETAVYFGASDKVLTTSRSVIGTIDRVTGDVSADFSSADAKTGKTVGSTSYALKCRPTQRMF